MIRTLNCVNMWVLWDHIPFMTIAVKAARCFELFQGFMPS
jgi:hypothetical protein